MSCGRSVILERVTSLAKGQKAAYPKALVGSWWGSVPIGIDRDDALFACSGTERPFSILIINACELGKERLRRGPLKLQ